MIGCGELKVSSADRLMRIQGSYLCPPHAREIPKGAKANESQVSCYRDSLEIEGNEARWTRSFYSKPGCVGATLGVAEWRAPLKSESDGQLDWDPGRARERMLTRTQADWTIDLLTDCDLRKVPLNSRIPAQSESACLKLFPPSPQALIFHDQGRESSDRVTGDWDGKIECSRWPERPS